MALTLLATGATADVGFAPSRSAVPQHTPPPPSLSADLPLDRQGIPTRPLDDAELYRLLLALSATNAAATGRLADCHAAGTPYGAEGWRACILRRP